MPSREYGFCYDFYAVGQGLFSSGWLRSDADGRPRFRWVYDCGTSSKQALVKRSIGYLEQETAEGGETGSKVDLVTISHFDNDHISGVVSLASTLSIRTLLLPYVPLSQRILLAFAEGVDTQQPLMQFFINPVAYITARNNVDIEQIVLVLPGGDEGPFGDENAVPAPPEGDRPWDIVFERAEPTDDDQSADLAAFEQAATGRGISVAFMRPGGRFRIAQVWEFVPYNDAHVAPQPTAAFRKAVAAKRSALLAAPSDPLRNAALGALKGLYDNYFGKSAKQRNVISLFLYAGPIGATARACRQWLTRYCHGPRHPHWRHGWPELGWHAQRCSILYTGDGYLDTKGRLVRLVRYLGASRIKRISCLQVMHHGAARNWHAGLAERLAPDVSIFSSDPQHKGLGHPHAPVLRDFWSYGPVQVDGHCGATIHGRLLVS